MEQSAAAAESLKGQAQQMVQAVAVFKLSGPSALSGPCGPSGPQAMPAATAATAHRAVQASAGRW